MIRLFKTMGNLGSSDATAAGVAAMFPEGFLEESSSCPPYSNAGKTGELALNKVLNSAPFQICMVLNG